MISRRRLLASTALAAPMLALPRKTAAERINVLFIGSDDCRATLGCYGHPLVKTPHLDALAARGVRFDRAYCNFPLCGPSRTSMLSGVRPDTTKIWENQLAVRDRMPEAITLPQLFRQSGWESTRLGKMYHMDVPESIGTNNWDDPPSWNRALSLDGPENKTIGEGRNPTPGFPSGNAFHWISFAGDGRDQADQRAADQAVELIRGPRQQPYFLGLGLLRPHVPLVAPSKFFDLYPLDKVDLRTNPAGDVEDIPQLSEITITRRGGDMKMNERDKREVLRAYYASVSYMDSLVGQVLQAVEKKGELTRTAVVFWSDHGYHLGEHFRWQKRSLFEESSRVPLIVAAPGRKARGATSRALVELVDVYPTVAELAGLTPPAHLEGQSFVPLLDRPQRPWKTAAFTQVYQPPNIVGRAVVTQRYRYIQWTGEAPATAKEPGSEDREELYDHQTDPHEFTNLSRNPVHSATLAQMRQVMAAGWKAARAKA